MLCLTVHETSSQRSQSSKRLKHLVTLINCQLSQRSHKCRNASAQLPFLTLYSPGSSDQGMFPPTIKMSECPPHQLMQSREFLFPSTIKKSSRTSINATKRAPHTQAQRLISQVTLFQVNNLHLHHCYHVKIATGMRCLLGQGFLGPKFAFLPRESKITSLLKFLIIIVKSSETC